MTKKILTVVGARPQFIKAATVSRAFKSIDSLSEIIVHTGQHYDANMSDIFFEELEIPRPTFHLGIGSGSHGAQTGQMLQAIEAVLLREKPDCVLVYGDTNSTLAGALAAAKLHIPVAHVEAGLRSFNRKMPEEINRVMTDHLSELLFAPTQTAIHHLKNEGIADQKVLLSGDVMYDASIFYGHKSEVQSQVLERLELRSKQYILATIHRAENTDDPIRLHSIFDALAHVSDRMKVVLPLHPRTRNTISKELSSILASKRNLLLIEPLGYLDMVLLEKNAAAVATDSGGVQKEAFFYRVPCVTLRDETEWTELVTSGWNQLAPPRDSSSISSAIIQAVGREGQAISPYGDGDAARLVASSLRQYLF